jgi:hypothetical protein
LSSEFSLQNLGSLISPAHRRGIFSSPQHRDYISAVTPVEDTCPSPWLEVVACVMLVLFIFARWKSASATWRETLESALVNDESVRAECQACRRQDRKTAIAPHPGSSSELKPPFSLIIPLWNSIATCLNHHMWGRNCGSHIPHVSNPIMNRNAH